MEHKEKQIKVKELIEKIDNNDFGLYFFTLDTKGNATGGVANIYQHVKVLNDLGYKAHILHEKNDYHGVGDWLGDEYAKLPHVSIEEQNLNLSAIDYIIVPEIFSNVMEQIKDFNCKKIVLSQSYSYILELLKIDHRWDLTYRFNTVITTSQKQVEYIKDLFPKIETHIIPPSVPDYFKPSDKPKKPIISIYTRDQKDALKIVKSFYLQYPMYKWVTFRELRGLPKDVFAKTLGESCLAVWVDDISSYGTFPLEAIECETPVIGKIPQMVPHWMESDNEDSKIISLKDNGIWTNNEMAIPKLISEYMRVWLEDNVPQELIESIKNSKGEHSEESQANIIEDVYREIIKSRRDELSALLELKDKK